MLNQADVMSNNGKREEALMANWEIVGWYALTDPRSGLSRPEFWRSILPKITVPVYGIDQFANTFKEIPPEELKLLIGATR